MIRKESQRVNIPHMLLPTGMTLTPEVQDDEE